MNTGSWKFVAPVAIAGVIALLLLYFSTAASTVAIWERSETFQHGYIIFPVSAWLIWRSRKRVAAIPPLTDPRGLGLLFLLGLAWLLGNAGSVLVVEQFALVAMIPTLVWTLTGTAVVRALAFPLAYLLLAVPVGEFLIPPLREFTADFTVTGLRLTGIPVYREGMFFVIPSGEWSVIESCSGIRYLIASVTLGALYAYLTYRTLWRRVAFTVAAFVVPVLANGVRAYSIVLIAHLTDNEYATGVDHIVWGWTFFGIIMFLLFIVGSFWREDHLPEEQADATPMPATPSRPRPLLPVAAAAFVIAAVFPVYAQFLARGTAAVPVAALAAPEGRAGWSATEPFTAWKPHWIGPDAAVERVYARDADRVYLYVAYYATQRQDRELVNSQNFFVDMSDPLWKEGWVGTHDIDLGGVAARIRETHVRNATERILVWQWNEAGDVTSVNDHYLKAVLAVRRVLGQGDQGAAIILAAPYVNDQSEAETTLKRFIADMLPAVRAAMPKK